jgi:hypothetical protein
VTRDRHTVGDRLTGSRARLLVLTTAVALLAATFGVGSAAPAPLLEPRDTLGDTVGPVDDVSRALGDAASILDGVVSEVPASDEVARATVPETVTAVVQGLPAADTSGLDAVLGRMSLQRSGRTATPMPFSALAFELPDDVDGIWVRTTGPNGPEGWTFLEALEADEGPDAGSDDALDAVDAVFTDLAWVGAGTHLEAILPATLAIDEIRVHLIDTLGLGEGLLEALEDELDRLEELTDDPISWLLEQLIGDGEEDDPPPPPAQRRHWTDDFRASTARPAVTTRKGWGANESWRRGRPSTARPRLGVVHHTATRNDYSRSEAPAIVRAIYSYHTRTLGWSDIGYNLLIDRYGRIYEGRAGGIEAGVVGAHARGYNSGSFGVALIGNFEEANPTIASLRALTNVFAWQYRVHRIDRSANATVVHNGRRVATLVGHRDVGSTACPGRHVVKHLAEVRRQIARAR